eukprot:841810-Rhodomonas_salina.1
MAVPGGLTGHHKGPNHSAPGPKCLPKGTNHSAPGPRLQRRHSPVHLWNARRRHGGRMPSFPQNPQHHIGN